jgi:hypothetical protein
LLDPRANLAIRDASRTQSKGQVLEHRKVWVEGGRLKNHRNVALVRRQPLSAAAIYPDGARCRLVQARDHPQERALAGPRGAHHHEKRTFGHLQVDPAQGRDRARILLRHPSQLDPGQSRAPDPLEPKSSRLRSF